MLVVAIIIYYYTSNTIFDQINDKIAIMSEYESKNVVEIKNDIEKRVTMILNNTSLKYYIETINKEYLDESRDMSNYEFTFKGFLKSVSIGQSLILRNLKNDVRYLSFAYITTPTGIVVADSRENVSYDSRKYVGKQLEIDKYKDIKIGNLEYVDGTPLLFMNYPIHNELNQIIGYLIVALNTDIFSYSLNNILSTYGKISLINEKGIVLNNNGEETIGNKIQNSWFLEQINNNIEAEQQTIADNLLILNKIPDTDVYFAVETPLSRINKPAIQIRNIVVYIILFSTLIIFLIVVYVINLQLRPLFLLSENINKVGEGNLDAKVDIDRKDVIGKIASNFNKMVVNIKELLKKVKEDQEKIRRYEIRALHSQINSHFIYNTLDSINWLSNAKDYKSITRITVALSKFFRLSLNEGKNITSVKKEIEHIKNYIKIQKLRYPDKFTFKLDVDRDLYDKECIKIILQPLVENSLKHGLEKVKTGGLIKVVGREESGNLVFRVFDNGEGFESERISDIVKEHKKTEKYSALKNIEQRIKVYYGEEYGLKFYSEEDELTCVEIELPLKDYEGDNEYEKDDYYR